MTYNSFGKLFRFMSWGESHGKAIGCVIDGCPPNIPLQEKDIQPYLNQRKPGKNPFVTQRQEADIVRILSGTYQETEQHLPVTTGTPISLLIENTDQRSRDYIPIQTVFRPGHADYTYQRKYGIRDPRGGGRSSARETAMRVAAGAIARKILGEQIQIRAAIIQIGKLAIDRTKWSWEECQKNPFFCPDASSVPKWETYLKEIRKKQTSIGALIEVVAEHVPAGWGAPVYGKLDADLAAALMSINAVKGVEIGSGFKSIMQTGDESVDEMCSKAYAESLIQNQNKTNAFENKTIHEIKNQNMSLESNDPVFLTNHNGGILGGISTGQNIIARIAFKATSSIPKEKKTIDRNGKDQIISTKGRHDPCVGLRAPPIVEAMLACVLADHKLLQKAQNG